MPDQIGDALRFVAGLQEELDTANFDIEKLDDGRPYSFRPPHIIQPEKKPRQECLQLYTLESLVQYIENDPDGVGMGGTILHVAGPRQVVLATAVDQTDHYKVRGALAEATTTVGDGLRFGQYMRADEMNVMLQSLFADSHDRADVLRLIGTLKVEESVKTEDDGTTQRATARAGITTSENVEVPNPVLLEPYRTFGEIAPHPESMFIFRLRQNAQKVAEAALFEGDADRWRVQAVSDIAAWLAVRLEEVPELARPYIFA